VPGGRARRVRVIFNPSSGSKVGVTISQATPDELRALMDRHGLGADLVVATSAEEARASAREAAGAGYDLIVAAGGDGTVGTLACEILGRETALGILPLGSVMNIARMLGIPRDLEQAAAILERGEVQRIDVGEANSKLFFEAGSVGLNAAIFQEAQRFETGKVRSTANAVWLVLRYRPARMQIHLDDRSVRTRALMVNVANGPYTGVGFTVAPDADPRDGLFDVRVFRRFSRWELLAHLGAIAFGRRRYSPKVSTYRSARVRIESVHPLPCRADGHALGTTPVSFKIRRAALRIVAPPLGMPPGVTPPT
jgi:diacylglycerol kinase (ATP)